MIRKNGQGNVLSVFDNFRTDRSLPKFERKKSQGRHIGVGSEDEDDDMEGGSWKGNGINSWGHDANGEQLTFRRKIVSAFERCLGLKTRAKNVIRYGHASPIEFFTLIRKSLNEAQLYADRVEKYDGMIQRAKSLGQTAMVEILSRAKKTINDESILFAANFGRFLTEKDVIAFALQCKKGLKLDWMENFCRAIPRDIAEKKMEADQLKIFDNYVILHYDPTGQSFATTQAEEEAKKDPILFGVIDGVRKLYFIGDWKDEQCDLTLEEVEKILGRSNKLTEDLSDSI